MESDSARARKALLDAIKFQIRTNKPPETKLSYDRLRKEGFDDFTTMQMLGQCIAVEFYEIMKFKRPYNNELYVKRLMELPKEPYD